MEPFSHKRPGGARRRAFTLVELLVVMAIIVIMASLIVPSLRGLLDGFNLTGSADNVISTLTLARQTAMARNLPVEVRIYQRDTGRGRSDYNTLALLIPSAATGGKVADVWIGAPSSLTGNSIIIDADTVDDKTFSTVLGAGKSHPTGPIDKAPDPTQIPWYKEDTRTTTSATPRDLVGKRYVAFWFLPDGSTNLPLPSVASASDPNASGDVRAWSLTLHNFNAPPNSSSGSGSDSTTRPAGNYVAMVIDPSTGRVLTYRP